MKPGLTLFSALLAALLLAPLAAWADANPDFDDDAKPILKMQPGLLRYVESRFDVKDTGTAKYPGDDDRRPQPPYIFRARPIGSNGPFNLRLLIQPGPTGHILGVVDITRMHSNPNGPAVASRPPEGQPYPPQRDQPFGPGPDQGQPEQQPQPSAQAPTPAPNVVQVPELSSGPVDQQPLESPNQTSGPVTQPTPKQHAAAAQQPAQPTADTPSGPILAPGQNAANSAQPSLAPPPDPAPPAQ